MPTTTLTHSRVTWTNIVHPTSEDIRRLSECYPNFHPLNLQDCLTELEFPKIDQHDEYLLLVVQIPIWDDRQGFSHPAEVDIFVAGGVLVTSHHNELKPLVEMFERAAQEEKARIEWMEGGASPLLYHMLSALVDGCFPIVRSVDEKLRHIEGHIFADDTRHLLFELAEIRRNIISIRRILHPQLEVIRELEKGNWPFIHEELDIYWGDIGDHLAQLCAMLEEDAEVVGGLSETVDTLASHRIDEVVRLLTIVTVLTLPLTLLATIFGMNIVMPFSEHPLLFFSILGVGIALTLWLVWYLRKRKWL
jgi:magnesium transporter